MFRFVRPTAALFAVLLFLAASSAARAAEPPAGAVLYHNATDATLTLSNFRYTDASGKVNAVGGYWKLAPNENVYLLDGQAKITARKIEYDLTTADGKTINWSSTAERLTTAGDFANTFTAANLVAHRELLGARPVAPPAGNGPTQKQIENGVGKTLLALVSHELSRKQPDDLLEAIAIQGARVARDKLIASAVDDLFPQLTGGERRTIGVLAVSALDGNLTERGLRAAQAKATVKAHLERVSPDMAMAAEVAEFLVGVNDRVKGR